MKEEREKNCNPVGMLRGNAAEELNNDLLYITVCYVLGAIEEKRYSQTVKTCLLNAAFMAEAGVLTRGTADVLIKHFARRTRLDVLLHSVVVLNKSTDDLPEKVKLKGSLDYDERTAAQVEALPSTQFIAWLHYMSEAPIDAYTDNFVEWLVRHLYTRAVISRGQLFSIMAAAFEPKRPHITIVGMGVRSDNLEGLLAMLDDIYGRSGDDGSGDDGGTDNGDGEADEGKVDSETPQSGAEPFAKRRHHCCGVGECGGRCCGRCRMIDP